MSKRRKPPQIGRKIKDLRSLLGERRPITQEALGERLGVTRSQISSWEAEKQPPSADKLIALATLAPSPLSLYFWEQAGVNPSEIEKAVRVKMLRSLGRAALTEVTRVPKLSVPALLALINGDESEGAESPDSVAFPLRFVPKNAALICVQATSQMAGLLVQPDDLILVDPTQRNLIHFLNRFVAVASEDVPLLRPPKPEIRRLLPRGRPLTERDRREIELNRSRDPLVRAETERRNDALMAKILKEVLPEVAVGTLLLDIPEGAQNESHEGLSEGIPWRLILDAGSFTIPLTPWSIDKLTRDATLVFPEQARLRILGTVTGWLRASGDPILKERGAPIERGRPDE